MEDEGAAGGGMSDGAAARVDVGMTDGATVAAITVPAGVADGAPPAPAHPAGTKAAATIAASLQLLRLMVRR